MRIIQINSFFNSGGPPRIVQGIYNTLEEQGHSCVLAACRERPIAGMNIIKIGSPLNKYVHCIMTRLFDSEGLSSVHATKELIKKIKAYKPDVIQLHNLHGYYINYEILFKFIKETNVSVVWTLHDCWAFTGHCAYFDYIACEKWKSGCYNCPQKKNYPKSVLLDCSKRNYQKKMESFCNVKNMSIVTPSHWLADLTKKSFLREYPIEVIHNGIDLNVFKPSQGSFREKHNLKEKFIVLGVAQVWDERKGLDYFIKISKTLNNDFKVVLVGLSDKEKSKLPSNIIGINRTNNVRELVEIYTEADVFVNPTLEDNFPTTNLEALACGTPVITFHTGGSIESVNHNCGIVVEKGDLQGLENAILKISKQNISRITCISQAKNYEKKSRYDQYIRLYQQIII